MCGRYTKVITDFIANYHQYLRDFLEALSQIESQYNISPGTVQTLRCGDGRSTFLLDAKWGMVPFWSKDGKGYQVNARAETCHEKPFFKKSFEQRRCVTWATGYFEWQTTDQGKFPYFVHFADHRPFFFYGMWQTWQPPESKESVATFATLTTDPNRYLSRIHDRMPCIVEVDSPDVNHWLDHNDSDYQSRHQLLLPFESDDLVATPVSTYVNNTRNQSPKCIEPLQENA